MMSEINVTPFVDVMLVLLVIFMLTAPLMQHGLEVQLPKESTQPIPVKDIPTVTLEAGGPSELELQEVKHGVKGIETLLSTLGMVKKIRLWGEPEPVYYRSTWVRANRGGILLADVTLGSTVRQGDLLGTITDPMNNASAKLYSPHSGRIIGMARNQVVMPGFAVFHVGIQTDETSVEASEDGADGFPAEGENDDYVDGMSE